MVNILLNGAVHSFADDQWQRICAGEEDADAAVLRHVIQRCFDLRVAHALEMETVAMENKRLRRQVSELEKDQSLGWESKPARKKREKQGA